MATDISRDTTGIVLPAEVSNEIWDKTIEESAVMTLATQRSLPGAGQEFQTIDGEPEAGWVNETGTKTVSIPTFGSATWKGYKMAVIIPFSNEFKRDKSTLYSEIIARAPKALGTKLDQTVFGSTDAPGELFDTMADVPTVEFSDAWTALVAADAAIADNDGILNGFAFTPAAKSKLLMAQDTTGRPLFISDYTSTNALDRLMGSPVSIKKGVGNTDDTTQLGFAGDWTSAYYGVVEGITMRQSDQATLTTDDGTINLWQQNMFAVLFEFEVGFKLKYKEHFVKFVEASN